VRLESLSDPVLDVEEKVVDESFDVGLRVGRGERRRRVVSIHS
jgi:hypothetical protein